MGIGQNVYTSVGTGTIRSSTGASSITVTPNSSTLRGDLVVIVAYFISDPGDITDAGDGWRFRYYWSSYAGCGLLIGGCIAPRDGSSGWSGFTLVNSIAHTAQNQAFRLVPPGRWLLDNAVFTPSPDYYGESASATALSSGAFNIPSSHWMAIVGRGYNNGGTTTTVGNISNMTERFDTGNTSPGYGVVLNDAQLYNIERLSSSTSSLAVAKTNRIGFHMGIPIIGNVLVRNRLQPRIAR